MNEAPVAAAAAVLRAAVAGPRRLTERRPGSDTAACIHALHGLYTDS